MVLIALSRMGASEPQLRSYFENWQKENPALSKVSRTIHSEIRRDTWLGSLNQVGDFGPLQYFFQTWIERTSVDAVMAEVLSQIPPAPASVAFHGIIRLAYGLEINHQGEIAAGLAALVLRNFPIHLPLSAGGSHVGSVSAGLAHLSARMPAFTTDEVNITARMRAVIADPRFVPSLPTMPENPFEDMALSAITLYLQTENFTTLHMVTSLHAARIIFARLPAGLYHNYLPALWAAYCAAYVSIGAPQIRSVASQQIKLPEWNTLFGQACNSKRDHMIKLIYTCYQEYLHSDETGTKGLYLAAANAILHNEFN
jgi:hypothetical protein